MNSSTSKRKAKASKKRAAGRARGTSNQQETSTLEGGNKLPSIPNDPSVLSALDEEYQKLRSLGHAIPQPKPLLDSELAFGHNLDHLAHVDMEDESFSSWYRKTAGMHTIKAWCEKYNKHPYAWGALIMIHGVDEVSARLRSKVENYAVYSAVLLSASVVLLSMNEMNHHFSILNSSPSLPDMIITRIYLYSLCVSVSSHLCSILLSMSFVNALNEAGRDADVIRMFGEGQGFLATKKCGDAFQIGLVALAVSIGDIIVINFKWYDGLACFVIVFFLLRVLKPTSDKLFGSSSLMFYWRFGRAEDNEDKFDLRVPLERVEIKSTISRRLYGIMTGRGGDVEEEVEEMLAAEKKETEIINAYIDEKNSVKTGRTPKASGEGGWRVRGFFEEDAGREGAKERERVMLMNEAMMEKGLKALAGAGSPEGRLNLGKGGGLA